MPDQLVHALFFKFFFKKGEGIFDAVKMDPFFWNEKGVRFGWTCKEEMAEMIEYGKEM